MNRKRLSDLVRVLRGVPRKLFDMGVWSCEDDKCGTIACAAGHYIAAFPRRGLTNSWIGPEDREGNFGEDALALHFDIPAWDAEHLFIGPGGTPKQVARRFEKYMKTGEVPA